jgi:hypothetical protein
VLDIIKTVSTILGINRPLEETVEEEGERREDFRFDMAGRELMVRCGQLRSKIRLKDLSTKGASGITDLAVERGGTVFLELPGLGYRAAEIRWVRSTSLGMRFIRALDLPEAVRTYAGGGHRIDTHAPTALVALCERRAANDD